MLTTDREGSVGIITCAFGSAEHLQMARALALSVKLHWGGAMALVTDADVEPDGIFTHIVKYRPEYGQRFEQKLFLDYYTPFKKSLYIDSDCLLCGSPQRDLEALQGLSFAVFGANCRSGYHELWGVNVEDWIRRHQLESVPLFNAGVIYFECSPAASLIFDIAREWRLKYDELGCRRVLNGMISDEVCFAIAMAKTGNRAVEWGWPRLNCVPNGVRGGIKISVMRSAASVRIQGARYDPLILHFAGKWRGEPVYTRERARMSLLDPACRKRDKLRAYIVVKTFLGWAWPWFFMLRTYRILKHRKWTETPSIPTL